MADLSRLSARTCITIAQARSQLRNAGEDGRYTDAEMALVAAALDYAYELAEKADEVNANFEYLQKHGIGKAPNQHLRERRRGIVNLEEERARRRPSAGGDNPTEAA